MGETKGKVMTIDKPVLTKRQRATMIRALDLKRRFVAGIFPNNGTQQTMYKRLETAGLLKFVGYGHDIDGEKDGEVPVWELTRQGEKVATQLDSVGNIPQV
jgi:hypothetical protein